MGFGLWALVIYFFAQIAMSSIAMLFALRWIPHKPFSMDSARRLYGFGIKMMISSVIKSLYTDIRPLIICKRFSAVSLGYYERGQRFSTTISVNLEAAVQSVMFPVLSRVQDDKTQFSAILSKTKHLGSFIIFPAMFGMAAIAEPMVCVLLTEEWLPCTVFVQILCLAEAQVPITAANLLAIKSLGRSDIYAKLEGIRRMLMLIVLLISVLCFDSVKAIAVGFFISAWMDAVVTTIPLITLLGTSLKAQFLPLWKPMCASVIMFAAVFALNFVAIPVLIKLSLQIVLGAAVFLLISIILKDENLVFIINILRKKTNL
jgi:O-antigen/teichoic acid export membrane protein